MIDIKQIPEFTFEMILNAANEGIYGVDLEGKTTFCNEYGAHLLGYEIDEIVGQPQHNLIHYKHPDGSPYEKENCPTYATSQDGQIHHIKDEVFWKKDGTSLPVEYKSNPIYHNKKIVGAVITFNSREKELKLEMERHQALAQLRQSQQELKAVFNTVVDGIISIDEKGTLLHLNRAAESMFGYKSKEVLGKNVRMLMPEPYTTEHDSYLENYLKTGKAKVIGIGREVVGLRKDGSTFPMELGISATVNDKGYQFTGITKDISRLKQSMAVQARLVSVIENTDDAVLGCLLDGTINLWNRAAQRIFGYSESEIVGRHISTLVPDDFQHEPAYLIESIKRGQTLTNFETKRLRKDGLIVDVALTLSPFFDSLGEINGVSSIARDIRHQKELLKEKENLIQKLEEATLTDPLTGLLNRRGFASRLDNELARFRRNQRPFSILLLDIDHFKKINDIHGHSTGDRVLQELSLKLTSNTREIDTVCRWGGEEFLILLVESELSGATQVAEKIRAAIEDMKIQADRKHLPVTVSIGVSEFENPDTKFESFLKEADDRLYQAKSEGRNRVVASDLS